MSVLSTSDLVYLINIHKYIWLTSMSLHALSWSYNMGRLIFIGSRHNCSVITVIALALQFRLLR